MKGTPERACMRKSAIPSRKAAQDKATRVGKRTGTKLDYYRCDHCGYYHLTHKR